MPQRRAHGIPKISAGPWADFIKKSPHGPAVIAADKFAVDSQKAIEDCYRTYWDVAQTMQDKLVSGEPVQQAEVDVIYLLGKSIANESAFHERNRVKQALAVLSPGAENLYSGKDVPALLSDEAVEAMKLQRETLKTAQKLGIKPANPQKPKGKGATSWVAPQQQPNSRAGQQQPATAGQQRGRAAGGPKGRGRARGRN